MNHLGSLPSRDLQHSAGDTDVISSMQESNGSAGDHLH